MEKDSRKIFPKEGLDRMGCVRVFISMFDFRHGGSTQKLLVDKKRGSKRITGNGNLENKIDKPSCSCEESLGILDGENGLVEPETGRRSVKKLLEETKKGMQDDEKMQKICDSDCEGSKGKNRKRKSKSHESIKALVVADQVEREGWQDSDHQSASGLQESKSDETNGDYAEKFTELFKRLVAAKSSEIQSRKELLAAFQVLGPGEESFLKVSNESGLPLLKDDESLGSSQRMEEDNSKNVEGYSVVSEEKVRAAAQSDVVVGVKKRKFFSRKAKSLQKNSSVQSSSSQVPKTIVVLKPGPKSLSVESSSSEPHSAGNKAKHGTIGSQYFLSGIKRYLQSVIRKESRGILKDDIPKVLSDTGHNHEQEESFSNERTPGAPTSEANRKEDHVSENSKKNASRIYNEAKKHLSEMLTNGDIDENLSSKEVPKILGRILSLPEFPSPEGSPARTREHDFINVNYNGQEHVLSTLCQTSEKPKIQQWSSGDYSKTPELGSNDLADKNLDKLDETLSASHVQIPHGVSDTAKKMEFTDDEDSAVLDPLSGPCSSSNLQNVTDVDDGTLGMHNEEEDKKHLEQETFNEGLTPHSPLESPPNSSVRMINCQESATDVPGKSSPVSVLEPPFTEDDISPTSTRCRFVEMRMQPLCIKFDEPDAPEADKDNDVKTTKDDKESTFAYIEAVVKAPGLNWDELYLKSFYSEQLLEQSLMDDIKFCTNQVRNNEKLLFDCINEVLVELCGHEFRSGPWVSSIKPTFRLISNIENVVKEVQEGVYYHLLPLPFPHTLDQIVNKDLAKTRNWMDLQFDIDCIGTDTGELILEELLEEIIGNFINKSKSFNLWRQQKCPVHD